MSDADQRIACVVPKAPEIVEVNWGTIKAALGKGIADFRRAPRYGLFFGAFLPPVAWPFWAFSTS